MAVNEHGEYEGVEDTCPHGIAQAPCKRCEEPTGAPLLAVTEAQTLHELALRVAISNEGNASRETRVANIESALRTLAEGQRERILDLITRVERLRPWVRIFKPRDERFVQCQVCYAEWHSSRHPNPTLNEHHNGGCYGAALPAG